MNVAISFLPILLLLGILFVLIAIIRRLNNRGKGAKWIFIGYIILLFVSVGVYYLLPIEKKTTDSKSYSFEETQGSYDMHLYDEIQHGRVDDIDSSFIRESWDFQYQGEQLEIIAPENNVNTVPIYVEKVDDIENVIEVVFYQTPVFVEIVEVSKYTALPDINLSSNVLSVNKPYDGSYESISFTTFKQEFPFRQLSGEKLMDHTVISGYDAIYIRVSEGIELEFDTNMMIETVG
ncbi:hypothetical protein [Oceanobacillus rekensis]|uniref:hypothetical protein n=1 Tax=Oceanobacillus rekensis TaxID=937927 RepID=UPI000B43BACA|nr:hypothetical protein [Oceanobacillus rekensis]